MINGRCECGRIRYEVDSGITEFSHCHCSQCRRLHGAAYATFGAVARDKFRFISGENDLKVYASSDEINRVFCAECGSNILADATSEPDVLYMCMGAVDGNPPCPPGFHAFVGSKAAWHEITDDLPQYDEESSG
jgi:hypothetical protein